MERSVPSAISDDEINSNVLRWRVMREDKQGKHPGYTSRQNSAQPEVPD